MIADAPAEFKGTMQLLARQVRVGYEVQSAA